jgi:PIN domain nuclease of toxin-antitoxin system
VIGKLRAPGDLLGALDEADFDTLSIAAPHAAAAGALPPHHVDPFDRMLIAQATIERLRIVTVDPRCRDYEVDLLPIG